MVEHLSTASEGTLVTFSRNLLYANIFFVLGLILKIQG